MRRAAVLSMAMAFVAGGVIRMLGVGVSCPQQQVTTPVVEGRYVVEEVVAPGDLQMYSAVMDLGPDHMVVRYDREDGSSWQVVYTVTARTVEALED